MSRLSDLLFVMFVALTMTVAGGCALNVGDDDDNDTVTADDDDDNDTVTTDDDDDNDANDTASGIELSEICDYMLDCDGDNPTWPSVDQCVSDFYDVGCEDEEAYLDCMSDCVELTDCIDFVECGDPCYDICNVDY